MTSTCQLHATRVTPYWHTCIVEREGNVPVWIDYISDEDDDRYVCEDCDGVEDDCTCEE